jgi:hypothetical protein
LGVVVTEDINTTASNKLRTSSAAISQAPRASVMNPLGLSFMVSQLFQKIKDWNEIYYTKPNLKDMCGIVGYIGYRAYPIVIKGLKNWNIEVW